jgi:hypothetical protein
MSEIWFWGYFIFAFFFNDAFWDGNLNLFLLKDSQVLVKFSTFVDDQDV